MAVDRLENRVEFSWAEMRIDSSIPERIVAVLRKDRKPISISASKAASHRRRRGSKVSVQRHRRRLIDPGGHLLREPLEYRATDYHAGSCLKNAT